MVWGRLRRWEPLGQHLVGQRRKVTTQQIGLEWITISSSPKELPAWGFCANLLGHPGADSHGAGKIQMSAIYPMVNVKALGKLKLKNKGSL